jgi:paraquat-inducible protein B
MTDTTPGGPSGPERPKVEAPRPRTVISAVWLVPLLAVVIALAIAWQSYRDRGELITITFPDAAGIEVGQTPLRFRDVIVGVVEDVAFTPDLARVNVYVRVNQNIAPFLDESAAFWIVEPEVTARGITGLSTILSGVYIEGTWDSEAGEPRTAFRGDDRAPVAPPDEEGTTIVLRSSESNRLSAGAPILYKGIEVGELAEPRLTPGGTEVRIDAFIRAPYDRRLTTATRFWDASGIGVSLGGGGVELRIESLAAVLEGGLVFDTLLSGGTSIRDGHIFDVYDNRNAARSATFAAPESRSVRLSTLFPSAASGLAQGAPVRYQGVRVGSVSDITGFVRPDDPTRGVQLLAVLELQPSRMGLETFDDDLGAIDYVGDLVAAGLRARLVSTSLLGGSLAVELIDTGAEGAARLEVGVADNPLIPSVDSEIDSFADTAEGVLTRINDLPVEELLAAATDLLDNLNRVVDQDSLRGLPAAALGVLEEGEALVGDAQGLVRDGRSILSSPQTAGTLADIAQTVEGLRGIVSRIAAAEVAERLGETLEAAAEAARSVATGAEALPDLATQAGAALAGAEALLEDEATRALPGTALAALEAGRAALASPEVEVILNQTAAAVRDLRDVAGEISDSALAARIGEVLSQVEVAAGNVAAGTSDLDALAGSLGRAVEAAEGILASEAAQALPEALRGTLATADSALAAGRDVLAAPEVATILAEAAAAAADIRAVAATVAGAELAPRIDAALAQVEAAAGNVAAGTAGLPALAESLGRAVDAAEGILASADAQALPSTARAALQSGAIALAELEATLAAPEIDALVADAAATAANLRGVSDGIAEAELAAGLDAALASVETASENIARGTADLDALAVSVGEVVDAAREILASADTQALPASARAFLDGGTAVVTDPGIPLLITELTATTQDVRGIVSRLAADEAAARLTGALEAAERAALSVAAGTEALPALSESAGRVLTEAEALGANLNQLTAKANALALDDLVDSTTALMRSADAFLSSDEADDVPVVLADALEEVRATLEAIRTGGTIEQLNATLASAGGAADSIQSAAADLPALVQRLAGLSNQAGTLLASYGTGSRLNNELVQTLRAATRAAEDVSALSRSLERNPNSLIFGR